jgi:hypothetical protein
VSDGIAGDSPAWTNILLKFLAANLRVGTLRFVSPATDHACAGTLYECTLRIMFRVGYALQNFLEVPGALRVDFGVFGRFRSNLGDFSIGTLLQHT